MRRTGSLLAALVLASVLAACGGGEDDAGASAGSATSTVPSTSTSTSAPSAGGATSTSVPAGPEVRVVALRHAGGEVTGGRQRIAIAAGERVRLEVTSDVAEEVHVHGYDLEVPVAAGSTTPIELVGDLPGVWEVELHGSGDVLAELEVAG